ncbi:MAG: hypothetical protein IJP45_00955 [Paludibacteraceae bacterium]|nr:hypothetical protein [Paludibacteraceae bacterium]
MRPAAAQDYNSGYALGALAKDITTDEQTLVIKVADGVNASDFNVNITKNAGSVGTFTITDKTLNAAGTELTIKFTCATGDTDEGISANLNVSSVNTLDNKDYTVAISGTVGSAKEKNTLAWKISTSQFVNTTYEQAAFLTGVNNTDENITITSSDDAICELINGGASIRFKAAGTVTLRAQQAENAEYEGADESITVTVNKRTATFDFAESTLFSETEYPGLISVTNDPNNTLLPNLKYSGADTYMDIEEDGTVTTKTARSNSVTLNITFAGNTEWNAVSTSHTFKIVNKLPAPEFCLASLDNIAERMADGVFVRNTTTLGSGSFSWTGSALRVTTNDNYITTVVLRFDGIPNKLNFTLSGAVNQLGMEESANGTAWSTMRSYAAASGTVSQAFNNETSRYVRINIQISGGGTVDLNDLCVTSKPTFTVSPATVTIPTDGVLSTPQTVTVVHNDMSSITVTSSDPDFVVGALETVSGNAIGADNRGTAQFTVDFVGTDLTKTATLTLTGVPSSGDNIVKTVTARLNATHATHYALGRAFVASESGSGRVYVGNDNTEPAANAYRSSSERLQWCSGEVGANDDLTFHFWAQAADGYEFEGWYGLYDEETLEYDALISSEEHYSIPLTATSTSSDNPTTGTLYAVFTESTASAAPVFALEDLNMGSVVSGSGNNLQSNLVLQPVGEATRPLYIDREQTTIAFSDIAGHEGEAALFSAGAYASGSKSFSITFTPTGIHPATHTYQALATVTATNIVGTTVHTAVVSATVTPAALASFTVDASHTFANRQRNQSDSWNAVVGSLTNATTTPVITITGANAEYFSAGAWDAENHLFPITFAPTAVGANYTATATISVQNYDEVVTSHTITLTGTCIAAPVAAYDVKDAENQSVVGGDLYFGDFNPGEQATRKLYLVDIANMKEAPGYVPTISMEPEIAGEFVSAAYNTATHSFDVTFHAFGRTDEEMGVRSVPVTITMLNNDDVPVFKEFTLSAFVVKPADFDVRVTSSTGTVLLEGTWADGLAEANKTANAGCTLTLMRNITGLTTYQTVTNTFTLDLNGKRLSGKSSGSIIYVNASGKTLTIKDSKGSGIIENINNTYAGIAYGANVNAGTLVLHSGTIYVENKGASGRKAVGIQNKLNTNITINGGKVEVYGYNDSYGIYQPSDAGSSNMTITMNNGEIYVEGYQNIYGIVGYGQVNVNGGEITAKTTYTNARSIFLGALAKTTAANCYWGTLNMTGGTINSICTADADGERLAYGIYFGCSNAAMGDATATDGSHANKAAAVGTISNATINASTLGRYAYGIYALGSYNSKTDTYDVIRINNSTINATAKYHYAYGVYANAGVNGDNGACYAARIDLNENKINAVSETYSTACAVYGHASQNTLRTKGDYNGEYAVASTLNIYSGEYTATAATTTAYAVLTATRVKTVRSTTVASNRDASTDALGALGGNAEAYPVLNIYGGTYKAKTLAGATAHTIRSGGNTQILGGEFESNAATSSAVTIYVMSGKTTVTGATLKASAKTDANAAYCPATVDAYTLYAYAGEVELNNCTATVNTTETTNARGIYVNSTTRTHLLSDFNTAKTANNSTYTSYGDYWQIGCRSISGKATINGGSYIVKAYTSNAYGALLTTNSLSTDGTCKADGELVIKNATFTVEALGTNGTGGSVAYGVQAGGKATIDGCTINAATKTSDARGVYSIDEKTVVSNSTINATTTTSSAYGIIGTGVVANNGVERVADFELNEGNKVTAKANTEGAYAIYMTGATGGAYATDYFTGSMAVAASAVVNGGSYTANATTKTAYALHVSGVQVKNEASATPSIIVNDGKFKGTSAATFADVSAAGIVGHVVLNGGYYVNTTNLNKYAADGLVVTELASTRAEYTEGYRYEIALPGGNYVCQIGSTKYKTLEEALSVVTSGQTIYMIADYTLPAGDYILPSGATLLIPYTTTSGKGGTTAIGAAAATTTSATTPTLFRKLTFASGARLTSYGVIETSAQQKANGQYGANVGMASGPYGQLDLKEGSHIEMESGANLYCWGFVTGKGTINVKNGANTLEGFQLGDWCGGTNASSLIGNSQKVFPITHYFFQSIECPITYRPGAKALGSTHITVNVPIVGQQTYGQDAIALVGTSGAMFLMSNVDASADTWVMRDYDETTDQCVWTLNSGASIGNLTINISSYNMASKDYDLPITTNMSIVMNYGTMSIGQNAVFLPGSKLIVNKEATADINGVTVVAYDASEWTGTTRYFASYSPTWGTANPRKSIPVTDAEFFVHGKINIHNNGGVYTSASGANIHSTNEDAGEIIYTSAATGNKTSYFLKQGGTEKTALTVNPAKLLNGNGTYAESAGTVAGKTWTYINDAWQCWEKDGCFFRDAQNNYYAKPAELVQLSSGTSDENHLHHDAATGAHNYVWDADCYWWEVETTPATEGVYKSLNPDHNGKYNYYEYNESAECWKIKTVTVVFRVGTTNTNYTVNYGTKPKWLGVEPTQSGYIWDGWTIMAGDGTIYPNDNLPEVTKATAFQAHFVENPVKYNITFKNPDGKVLDSRNWESGSTPSYEGTPERDATVDKIYTWAGTWSPAITTVSATTEYTAQYNETTRQYDVTFLNYDNTELETKKVNYNVAPTYTGTPTRVDPTDTYIYTFSGWKNQQTGTTGLVEVKGDQTYVAQYTKSVKWAFITFADYNGTTITTGKVLRGTAPTPPANPTRERDAQYIYSFNAWSPAITNADENQTYTATYNTTLRSYTIRFVDYKGDDLKDLQVLPYGSKPTAPASVADKSESEEFANWDDVIRTVSEDKTYIAQYRTKRYTLTIASNNTDYGTVSPTSLTNIQHGSTVVISGNSFTVDEKTVTATPAEATAQYTYAFDHWNNVPATVTDNVSNIEAVFTRTLRQYTITWLNDDGSQIDQTEVDYGVVPTHEPATKDNTAEYTYTFTGWDNTPVAVTGNATYKATFSSAKNKYTITWLNEDDSEIDHTDVEYGVVPTHSDPTKASTVQYDYPFTGWSPAVVAVTAEATYKATFNNPVIRSYNVTWKNYDGSTITTDVYNYGVQPSYSGSTPTYSDGTGALYAFKGWKHERTNIEYAAGTTLPEVAGEETFTAQYSSVSELVVTEANPVEITNNTTVDVTTVKISGKLVVSAGTLTTNDLILEASADGSCDINGAEHITATGHVYFDYDFNTDPWHWTAFGVPFEIDLDEAAPKKDKKNPMNSLGNDYDIVYFNTANRAAHGPGKHCWDYLDEQAEHKLRPGVLYMIAFNKHVGHVDTVRFTKASTAAINYTESVALTTTGTGTDDNWNGIANPRIYHAVLAAGVTECQVHDGGEIGKDGYHLYDMNNKKFFVGKAAFVNVPNGQSAVTTTPATTQGEIVQKAPRRAYASTSTGRYDVQIAPADGEMEDCMFLLADEEKVDEYVIVADLAKMGVSPVRAQMWVDKYGVKLCKNTASLLNNQANYPLGIAVPATGEYDIYINEQPDEDAVLYLTLDGKPIWNLSYGAYRATLETGTTSRYGLRLVKKSPNVATGIEETTIENGKQIRKVLVDDKVYIIRNGFVYTIDGQMVK